MNVLAEVLENQLEEVYFNEFYQEIFDDNWGHQELDEEGALTKGKYIGIATVVKSLKERDKEGKKVIRSENRYIYDGLDGIHQLVAEDKQDHPEEEKRLTIISPTSYIGNRKLASNARFLYALCIELDGLKVSRDGKQIGLVNLFNQFNTGYLPKPTYIVCSGNGLHLYYKFIKPIPCFKNVQRSLARYKHEITRKLWNKDVTILFRDYDVQYESVFQPFRMVGTRTKAGDIVRAFRFGEPVTIEYMNKWAWVVQNVDQFKKKKRIEDTRVYDTRITEVYKSDLLLSEAKEKYPEWYERKIEKKIEKGTWRCKRDLYDWWKGRIQYETTVGHRYFCLFCLVIYAMKCGIEYEEVEKDCYSLMQDFNDLLDKEGNKQPFDEDDVVAALSAYDRRGANLCTYPITFISEKTRIDIKRNRRNGRSQAEHLKRARYSLDLDNPDWRNKDGRPKGSKDTKPRNLKAPKLVQEWRKANPDGRKADCIRATGLDKKTVYKWWDAEND